MSVGIQPYFDPGGIKNIVLAGIANPVTKAMYGKALDEFLRWWVEHGRPPFGRQSVRAHRAELQKQGYAPSTVNQRLSAIKKLAREAASNGILDPMVAVEIDRVEGVKERGHRVGKWLDPEQVAALLDAPEVGTLRGKRDRALLALLVGCGLRRAEAAGLLLGDMQERAGRPLIVDLRGKHGRIRTVTVPVWVKEAVATWCAAAKITEPNERILRSVHRRKVRDPHGKAIPGQYNELPGHPLTPEAMLLVVSQYGVKLGLGRIRPHDLRRTCAKLCRQGGADLEQIQMLLGHASIQTTERYLGGRQDLQSGPNDHLPIPFAPSEKRGD